MIPPLNRFAARDAGEPDCPHQSFLFELLHNFEDAAQTRHFAQC
jgi:hypothetical protein